MFLAFFVCFPFSPRTWGVQQKEKSLLFLRSIIIKMIVVEVEVVVAGGVVSFKLPMLTFELPQAPFCRKKQIQVDQRSTSTKFMLTFDLPWPPFCRNWRFLAIPKLQNLTSGCQKNLENMTMLNSHFDDFKASYTYFFGHVSFFLSCFSSSCIHFFLLVALFLFWFRLPSSASLT